MKYLNWDNIVNDTCPSCGFSMEITKDKYICTNHKGNSFIIPIKRVKELKSKIQEREDFSTDFIKNLI